jgi:hypothetical protein
VLQGLDDVVKTTSTVNVLVDILALALIRDVVVVNPAAKAFLGLREQAVEQFVSICFD